MRTSALCFAWALVANSAPALASSARGDCAPTPSRHDGFFARVETGLALTRADARQPSSSAERTAIRAIGQSTTLAVGATPFPGLVVAGSLWAARLDPVFYELGSARSPDDDSVKLTWARVGPLVSYYPDPGRGFHADVSLAVALAVESDEKGRPLEPGFAGPAFALALGYDWFVASQLSLGLSARLSFARVTRSHEGRGESLIPEILEFSLAYTYH